MGDLRNSRARLKTLLKSVQYPHLHATSLESASVKDLLRILHFALLDYSRAVAAFIQSKGYDLYGKTDARFVDSAFRLLRDEFKYFPSLNSTQFLSEHYWERKLNLVSDVLQLVLAKHDESAWLKRQQDAVWTKPREPKGAPTRVENHILPPHSQEKAPGHAASVLQLLRHNQSKSNARRLKAPDNTSAQSVGGSRRGPSGADTQSPERQSNERRTEDAWNGSAQQQSQPNGETHGRKKRVTFDAESNDVKDDRTNHFYSPTYEAAIDSNNSSSRTTDTDLAAEHLERSRPTTLNTVEVAETLTALSNQIARLSSAFMTKITSVEERLSRLESQIHTLSTTFDQQHQTERKMPLADTSNAEDDKENRIENQWRPPQGRQPSEAANRLRFQIESCSWPPKPSAFARA